MNWTDWLMLVVYGLTCLNVGYLVSLSNTVDARRKEIYALNEAVALWNYGAREEAIATLKAAGVLVQD